MKKCLKENKLCLLLVIIICLGIVLMVIFREELLGDLVKCLAYPILIFYCFYLIKKPLIKLLESRIKVKTKNVDIELGIPQEVIRSVFSEEEVTKEKYLSLTFLTGVGYLALADVNEDSRELHLKIANDSIEVLEANNWRPVMTNGLKRKRDDFLKRVTTKEEN